MLMDSSKDQNRRCPNGVGSDITGGGSPWICNSHAWDSLSSVRPSHRSSDRTTSRPEQLSHVSSWPTWSTRERHSCVRWGSSLSSFWPKRRSVWISWWVRAESMRDSHGMLTSLLWRARGSSVNEDSPKLHPHKQRKEERSASGCFLVLPTAHTSSC